MGARILVIEDEAAINDVIRISLEAAGHEAVPFFDGSEASEALKKRHDYGCAVVDVMLPGKDGFALLPELVHYGIPVIFLTARGEVADKVRGLTGGAEDYMVKPFEIAELLVRVNKVLERHAPAEAILSIGDVAIDPAKRTVTKGGADVYMKPMEFDCLMMLMRNRNKAVTRAQLLTALWGMEFEGETRTVDAHVGRIRKKLGLYDAIKTVPRIGYRLEVDE